MERRENKWLRVDLIISTLALLASVSASIAVIVQTRTITNQLSASVWPYLTFTFASAPGSFSASIENQGLGPALVRTAHVTMNDRPTGRMRDLILAMDRDSTGRKVTTSDIGGGIVVRPGDTLTVFRLEDSHWNAAQAQSVLAHAGAELCYCSLLGNCWRLSIGSTEPKSVDSCGPPTPMLRY